MPDGWIHLVPTDWWPWMVAAAGALSLIALALLMSVVMRQKNLLSHTRPQMTPARQRTLERDVSNLLDDLADMARQVGSQLDAKAVRLEALIREADDRLKQLDGANREARTRSSEFSAPTALSPAPAEQPAHPALTPMDAIDVRPVVPSPAPSSDWPDQRHVEIYTLADQGLALQDIAQRLRRPSGEVELILALRHKVRRAGHAD